MTKIPEPENIIIYRDRLLPASETFVRSQALALTGYSPFFVGSKRVGGLELPDSRVILVNSGNSTVEIMREGFFKLTLRPPRGLLQRLLLLSPRLVHAHFAFDAVFALPVAEALGVPLLVTLHGFDVTADDESLGRSPRLLYRLFPERRRKLAKSDNIRYIAVSEYIKQVAVKRGFPEDRIKVHYVGVDVDRFVPSGKVPRRPKVVFAGRLVENKGCAYLIRAMEKVQAALPDTQLVVIGDGELRKELEDEARRSLRHCVFTGMINHESALEHMQDARVVCVPSVAISTGESEGFGIVFVEAQAMGVPVVSTYAGGIPEAVVHRRTGLLTAQRDVEGLAASLIELIQDDDMWMEFSRNCRNRCEERFSIAKQTKELEDLYSGIIRQAH